MKATFKKEVAIWGMWMATAGIGWAQYSISTPGGHYAFQVNGTNDNPSLTLAAGATYTFQINTSTIHPVDITTAPDSFDRYSGASPQDINTGTITLIIPAQGYPDTLYYICNNHNFFGTINVVAPLTTTPPPSPIIVSVVVTTNVVLKSQGTNTTWLLVPECNSNLVNGAWQRVTNYVNSFANGTNTTVFDRLDPICGRNVFLRIRLEPPP
jgi:hypothetical protein